MIHVTLTAMPMRTGVLAAKAAILSALVSAAGAPAVLASVLAGPWAGLAVLAAWAVAALIAGGLLLKLRDA